MSENRFEAIMPVLSAGRHRSPRRGACFMEYASYLAGLRWSDRPACTHPSLAALARLVNDLTSDDARSRLVIHVPSVVGLTGDDPRVPVVVSALAAAAALPVACESRQHALATALLRCETLMAGMTGPSVELARARTRRAFEQAPGMEAWARRFLGAEGVRTAVPLTAHDEAILRTAAIGIADACTDDRDARLGRLLADAIAETSRILRPESVSAPARERMPVPA
ncbi:hypothetical protein [Galbitalea soli]|uniref:Uncharacterized protein n=1 Tax=Galbitalea soli TaxID=1268042 RepID=A0A7C9TRJ7_9MICO|nr:hypothetical protein [Galbitalea soli]NEM91681.1 hypothetical protein [Galbitalea soli]NYJ30377.1 hypothetical protein [Galbitalea soli]